MSTSANKEVALMREQQVWELRLRFWNQSDIAQHIGISQAAVSQILKRIRTRLAEQYFNGEAGQMLAEQAEQLLLIARESMAAWEQSKQQPLSVKDSPPLLEEKSAEEIAGRLGDLGCTGGATCLRIWAAPNAFGATCYAGG